MKSNWFWIGLAGLALAACEKQEEIPKATVVVEDEAEVETSEQPAPEPLTPEVPPVPETGPTVGERVDRAIEATGSGLQTAGEKTREGVTTAAEKTGEALETAGEKTEEGVRTAAEATGGFLKRVGERLEEAAGGGTAEEPVEPVEP